VRWFFQPDEKAAVLQRSRAAHNTGEGNVLWRLVPRALAQPQFWMIALIYAGAHFCTGSISAFAPDMLRGLGYEGTPAQLLSVAVYGVAFVAVLAAARLSDRISRRGLVVCACAALGALGYLLLLVLEPATSRLVATCVVAAGVFPINVLAAVWMASNNVGYTYRASAVALANIVSQLIAMAGSFAFTDPPYYRKGLGASLGMVAMTGVVSVLLMVYLRAMNARKTREQRTEKAAELRDKSIEEVGNNHPDFFFSF
jgi:MFS family permease